MLVRGIDRLYGGDWHMRLACNVLKAWQNLAHRYVARVLLPGVIRAPEKDREEVRSGNVLSEYAIDYRIALRIIEGSMDPRATVGS
jgi:hypothetical protein